MTVTLLVSSLVPRLCVKVGLANNDIILGSAEVSSYQLPSDRDLVLSESLAYLDQPSSLHVFSEPLECVATTSLTLHGLPRDLE